MNDIEFKNTSMWYDEVIALNQVTFKFTPGITGLVGSNGAGKTTAIKLAASLLKPTLGTVTIDGQPIWQNYEYLEHLGYSPEIDRQFNFLTGRKFLEWSAKLQGMTYSNTKKQVNTILERIGMTHAADRRINGYSRGMRQRVKIGQSLLHDPQVLLADEPLSGTDPIGRNILVDLFKELAHDEGVTVVVSSHVLHELERISDRIIVLESGKLVAEGKVAEVRAALSRVPQKVKIVTNDSSKLSKRIVNIVQGLKIQDGTTIIAEVSNRRTFAGQISEIADQSEIKIFELAPLDEDLTSVFKLIKSSKNTQLD